MQKKLPWLTVAWLYVITFLIQSKRSRMKTSKLGRKDKMYRFSAAVYKQEHRYTQILSVSCMMQ